jgi:hypothetical protein
MAVTSPSLLLIVVGSEDRRGLGWLPSVLHLSGAPTIEHRGLV